MGIVGSSSLQLKSYVAQVAYIHAAAKYSSQVLDGETSVDDS